MSFRYWRVMFFRREGCRNTRLLHSSLSILPSCFVSASSKVLSMILSMTSSERFMPDSARVATTICFTSCLSMKPCCFKSYNWNEKSIFSSSGALGWKTERARANSSKSNIPLCLVSNKSNTRSANKLSFLFVLNKAS
uniref:Uncharacterized protein n=1 Tax=Opuntia streptacantha TaxID=393608 RepID=A0A7C9DGY1_OPUST